MTKKTKVNWAAYDKSLIERGSITFWLSDEAIESWYAKPTGKKGAQPVYTDLAIESSLSLRLVFKQALRQTEGLVNSIFKIMAVDLSSPDHSTLSKRGAVIPIKSACATPTNEPLNIVIDSTGLKIFGAGEWSETKHGLKKRRQWRKLHLTVDSSTLEIIESSLTDNTVGDSTEAINQLEKIDAPIDSFMGDGAYDCQSVYTAVETHDQSGKHAVTIPPRKNAVLSDNVEQHQTQRDKHVEFIDRHGRAAWEIHEGYSKRLLAENAMGRFKGIIGSSLRARNFQSQIREALLGCHILNKMIRLGSPLVPASEMA